MRLRRASGASSARLAYGLLLVGVVLLGRPLRIAAAQSTGSVGENRMAEIIAAVRDEEAKYRNIEYRLKITRRQHDPAQPGQPLELTVLATHHVVLQGDRVYVRRDSHERVLAAKVRRETISAYDGEKTRTVNAGNCVNIHLGRFEHPEIYQAHCLPLAHVFVNFPLSTYLGGTDAIHAHTKCLRLPGPASWLREFARVVCRYAGEEKTDGLRCLKIRVTRYSSVGVELPIEYLWLAPERNYACIKEQVVWNTGLHGRKPTHEMQVEALREIAPGFWFPMKWTVVEYDSQALARGQEVVQSRTEMIVERVDLAPGHDAAFFHDVAIPADLPLFTIKDRTLLGSARPPALEGDLEKSKLAEVAAQIAEQEKRYSDLEIKARFVNRHFDLTSAFPKLVTEQQGEEHSIRRGASAYFSAHSVSTTLDGMRSAESRIHACDGEWLRSIRQVKSDGEEPSTAAALWKGANQVEGRNDAVTPYRPHVMMLRNDGLLRPLAGMLVPAPSDEPPLVRWRFYYCGVEQLGGRRCVKLRGDAFPGQTDSPSGIVVLYLAVDRNMIPIRLERYSGQQANQPMPAEVSTCEDLREIAPGTWYPFRVCRYVFDTDLAMAQGQIVLASRSDYRIDSAQVAPPAPDRWFREVIVPEGVSVRVRGEDGQEVGRYRQSATGAMDLSPARYLKLRSDRALNAGEQRVRQLAMNALIGKPAPGFPQAGTWFNSDALTWEALRGKVVVLVFWAEWSEPGRDAFAQLDVPDATGATNELTFIGVHPPGSAREDIEDAIEKLKLVDPICVDVAPAKGTTAWGEFFGRCAVQSVPQAIAVDGKGTIVACGRLDDVVAKARTLAQKPR